nr:ATP-binding cassette domain-containing protein [Demequina sp. TTPB684]
MIIRDLTFRYPGGDHDVLSGLECDIPTGTTAAIVGPSGSGKTTLISVLGGLLPTQGGTIRCVDSTGGSHSMSDVSTWVLQTVSLLPERTVLDNVCLGAYLDGASTSEARIRARAALDDMGLAEREDETARVLSGGEAQRVAIARALASDRPVLFADEPSGQLDAETTSRVMDAMLSKARRTVVLVTHDEEAASRCDTILRLKGGRLTPERGGPRAAAPA